MLPETELFSTLRLLSIPNIGEITAKKLLTECGNPSQIFKEATSALLKIDGVGSYKLRELHHPEYGYRAEKELQYIVDQQINYSYFFDENYPELLKHCADSPLLLFTKGEINFEADRFISIVGTRKITSYGNSFLEKFLEDIGMHKCKIAILPNPHKY